MTTILGIDVSHHQNDAGPLNFAQVRASGREFVVIKATEGTGYVDPALATNRRNSHAAGLIVGFYHFARLGSPAAEAAWFARTVGPLQPGEFIVLDYEPNPVPPGSAAWSKAWLDAARAALGVAPLIYMNSYTMGADNWSGVARDYGLWLAKYDHSTAASPTQWWPTEAMKQDNDKSLVVGVIGGVDDDVFYGTTAQLLAYGKGGVQPTPISTEDEVGVLRTPDGTIWLATSYSVESTGDGTLSSAWQKAYGPYVNATQAEVAALTANVRARVPNLARVMQVETILKQLCGDGATIEDPWPGTDKDGGWPLTPPDASAQRYTPVMFQQAILDAVKKLQAGGQTAVTAAEVAALVLAGIKAQMAADVPASS